MGANKRTAIEQHDALIRKEEAQLRAGTRRSATIEYRLLSKEEIKSLEKALERPALVECQRCGRSYLPNNFEVCNPCVDELDHNMKMDKSYE
jgi:ribosomal protein L32